MSELETFKTALVGGFDKDDVLIQVKNFKEEACVQQNKLQKTLKERDKQIEELNRMLSEKEDELAAIHQMIEEKYKKYEENYNSIGKLVFDAQIKSDRMISKAEAECDAMKANAKEEAVKMIESVEKEIDAKLADGKQQYAMIQHEMQEIAAIMNEAQSRFMNSYKEVHRIISTIPNSLEQGEDTSLEAEEKFHLLDD